MKCLNNGKVKILIECDWCAGVEFPILNEVHRRQVESSLAPLEHTFVVVEEFVGLVNDKTIFDVVQRIWSLDYESLAWKQRRQYLEIINCSVKDYEIVGDPNGNVMLKDHLEIVLSNPSPLLLIDKTLLQIKND